MTPTLVFHLLGRFQLSIDGVPVRHAQASRFQSALGYLAIHRDSPQRRQRLAFLLWPDTQEAQAFTNLRNLLFKIRHELPLVGNCLSRVDHTLAWDTSATVTVDTHAFVEAFERRDYQRAADLYGGDLLPDCYDEWVLEEREHLRNTLFHVLENLVRELESQQLYALAILQARRLLALDPLHEDVHRKLMQLHDLNGDRAGAVRVYRVLEQLLWRELQIAPSTLTRELYDNLLRAD